MYWIYSLMWQIGYLVWWFDRFYYLFSQGTIQFYFSEGPITKPFFLNSFTYEPEVEGIIRIMRKSDGKFMASIPTPPYFATHMVSINHDCFQYLYTVEMDYLLKLILVFIYARLCQIRKRLTLRVLGWTCSASSIAILTLKPFQSILRVNIRVILMWFHIIRENCNEYALITYFK